MNVIKKYEQVYFNKNNREKWDRKLYIIKNRISTTKCYSVYTYYKKKRQRDHNALKTEKNERIKERDDKY